MRDAEASLERVRICYKILGVQILIKRTVYELTPLVVVVVVMMMIMLFLVFLLLLLLCCCCRFSF